MGKPSTTKKVEQGQQHAVNQEAGDIELDVWGDQPPLIPEGEHYVVSFLRGKKMQPFKKGGLKLFFLFQVVLPIEFDGVKLNMAMNFKPGLLPVSSKFYQLWVLANGGPPGRHERFASKILRNKYFNAVVRTVKTNSQGKMRHKLTQYSVIDRLTGINAG